MKIIILLSVAGAAMAQTGSSTGTVGGILTGTPGGFATATTLVSVIGPGMGTAFPSVTGMPMSAEQVTSHVQTLADGTHITQPGQKMLFYRDSQGRTRTEHSYAMPAWMASTAPPPAFVEIVDPVKGVRYSLNSQNHTAQKMPLPNLRPAIAPNRVAGAGNIVPASRGQLYQYPMPAIAPAGVQPQRPETVHESLGTRNIEGVLAEGTRNTMTYPIGSIGNDRPITTVSESWLSAELKMVVLTTSSDPRNGESTTRLTNISRAEPSASLFEVPPDYQIVEPRTEGLPN